MYITIFFKNGTGNKDGHTYYFASAEYKQLSSDFENYLKTGSPLGGKYTCQEFAGAVKISLTEGTKAYTKELMLEFDAVAMIDVDVSLQMEKLSKTFNKTEKSKAHSEDE